MSRAKLSIINEEEEEKEESEGMDEELSSSFSQLSIEEDDIRI